MMRPLFETAFQWQQNALILLSSKIKNIKLQMQFNAKIENLFLIPSDNNRVSYMILHVRNLKSNSSYWQIYQSAIGTYSITRIENKLLI